MRLTHHQRKLVIVFVALGGMTLLPSYVWAYELTSSSASPTINIGGSFLVSKASYDSGYRTRM